MTASTGSASPPRFAPKPDWLKVRAPGGERYHELKQTLRALDLYTVCEEARCPNVGECWRDGTATVMLLGDVCTRGCRFCAVTTGDPRGAVDPREPEHVARAIAKLGLVYVVMTMVNRDDLLDGGADHVARTVRRLRELRDDILIETLVGDFAGRSESGDIVAAANPDVLAHNVETVERLQRTVRDVRASYARSLELLERSKAEATRLADEPGRRPMLTKSSIMVGLGESDEEVIQTMRDLRGAGVDVVTLGQYLRPTPKHHEVVRFVTPETFDDYAREALSMGFLYAASGPLVRSSYKAGEVFIRSLLGPSEDPRAALDARLARAREAALRLGGDPNAVENRAANAANAESFVPATSLVRAKRTTETP